MCTYERLVEATLRHGLMPLVVPQLKTITLGGAVTGLGIESSSFRTACRTSRCSRWTCSPAPARSAPSSPQENTELFDAFPNSYGSLGYALRLRIGCEPVAPYVALRARALLRAGRLAAAVATIAADAGGGGDAPVDFLDGVVFAPDEALPDVGRWADRRPAPATTPGSRSTTARSGSAPPTASPCTTTCGAGTPTGSGARPRSACSTRWCAGSGPAGGGAATSTTAWSGWRTATASPPG